MTVIDALKSSLSLLSKRDRRKFFAATAIQMSTSFMDLVGVMLVGVVTSIVLAVSTGTNPPLMVSNFLDFLHLDGDNFSSLALWLSVVAGLLLVGKSFANVVLTRRVLRFLANRQAVVSGKLAANLLSRPLIQLQQRSSQETAYALTSGVSIATLVVLGQGAILATEAALLLVLASGLFLISPLVTIFTIAFFLLIAILLQRLLSGWAHHLGQQVTNTEIQSLSLMQEALRTYRETVVTDRRGLYVRRFQDLRWRTANIQSDLQFLSLVPKYVFEFALVLGAGLLAGFQLMTQDVGSAIAIIALFLAAGSRIVPAMLRLQGALITIRGGAGQAQPTYELARELMISSIDDSSVSSPTTAIGSRIRTTLVRGFDDFAPQILVEKVCVTYPGSQNPVLNDVSFQLAAGQSLALIGPTGAGKSTLADVILGIVSPESGTVEISGFPPLEAISRWPGGVAYVPQDIVMTNSTVRDNVALGLDRELIDDEWVWYALKRAELDTFLRESRSGLDTLIGEHGLRLSGGQRQRLGLARALYSRPKLLVLDEATSALDAETERAISQALESLEGEVTTVTIAHRLATVTNCDLVAYLDSGNLIALGTFEEVRSMVPALSIQASLLGLNENS